MQSPAHLAVLLAALALSLAPGSSAAVSQAAGDVAPGTLDTSTTPPIWRPAGDGAVTVADIVALLRTSVGLQEMLPGVTDCPNGSPVLGDIAPGALAATATTPAWVAGGDGAIDVADVVAALRVAVALQEPESDLPLAIGNALIDFACPRFTSHSTGGTAQIDLVRSGDLATEACVEYATADGSATAGSDYGSASGTLCFDPGETEASFLVNVFPQSGTTRETVVLRANAPGAPEPFVAALLVLDTIKPVARISPTRLRLGMPENCPQAFQVSNVGPPGSILQFSVADTGALGGFLDVQIGGSTSLGAGQSSNVTVSVKPAFVDSIVGSTLVLKVDTPGAANFTRWPEMIRVRANSPLGVWGGTWTGHAEGPQSQQAPVTGTWILSLESFDLTTGAASGSLQWNGYDLYWPTQGDAWQIFPNVSRTRAFDGTSARIEFVTTPQLPCGVYHLVIQNTGMNPSDAFYGPYFEVQLDANSGLVPNGPYGGSCVCGPSGTFETHPYDPSTMGTGRSVGRVQGRKLE